MQLSGLLNFSFQSAPHNWIVHETQNRATSEERIFIIRIDIDKSIDRTVGGSNLIKLILLISTGKIYA